MLELFATDSAASAGRDIVLVTIGGAIIKLIDFAWNWLTQSRADAKAGADKLEGHLEARIKRLEAENERCEARVERLLRRVRVLEFSRVQMAAYITNHKNPGAPAYVETLLPLDEEPESATDTHTALPPTEPKP